MLMTPARQQRKASKICKLNWRNKKSSQLQWLPERGTVQLAAISGPIALRHHLSMILPIRKIARGKLNVKGCPPLPMAGPLPRVASTPQKAERTRGANLPIIKKRHVNMPFCSKYAGHGKGRFPTQTRYSGIPTTPRCRTLAPLVFHPFRPYAPTLFAICGYHLRSHPRCCINS